MLKSETAIEKFSQLSTSQKSIYEKVNSSVRTHDRIDEARKSNMYLIAYCFSRFEHTSLFPRYNQTKSFDIAAEKLGAKKNTLKNYRDYFDANNDNDRKGWWKASLPDDMQRFKEIYDLKNNVLGIR